MSASKADFFDSLSSSARSGTVLKLGDMAAVFFPNVGLTPRKAYTQASNVNVDVIEVNGSTNWPAQLTQLDSTNTAHSTDCKLCRK